MNDDMSKQMGGYTLTASQEMVRFLMDQLGTGCPPVPLAAGMAMGLQKAAEADPVAKEIVVLLATLLKDYQR